MAILPGAQILPSPGVQLFAGEDINSIALRPPIKTNISTDGDTEILNANEEYLLISAGGPLATLTIRLPPNPRINQMVSINFTQPVTTLTIQDAAGEAVVTTSSATAVAQEYRRVSATAWRRWK